MGFDRASPVCPFLAQTGLALAQGKPAVPGVALTNPVWDLTEPANWDGSTPGGFRHILA